VIEERTTSAADLLRRIADTAEQLGDPQALDALAAVEEHTAAAKLQLLVIGSIGSGRSSVVDALLRCPDLLPPSRIPKMPLDLTVRYGASTSVEAISDDGRRVAVPPEQLRPLLTGGLGAYRAADLQGPCERLKTCDVRIMSIGSDRGAEAWRNLLAASDFTLVVLNATALLSHAERDLIRQHLATDYGLGRVAIAVNQMDLVPEEERESITGLVRTFLGSFESRPIVLNLSATELLRGLRAGEIPAAGDPLWVLMDDLGRRRAPLRDTALQQALEVALSALADGARRQEALLSIGQKEVQELRTVMESRREWLQSRIERTQRKVDTFVGMLLREQLLREVEGFGEVFRRRLPEEIRQIEDLKTIRQYLPGYMESVWSDFVQGQMIAIRSRLRDEIVTLDRMIRQDLQDLLGEEQLNLRDVLSKFDPGAEAMRSFVMPKRGKHAASGVAKALSLHAFIMLLWNPPLGAVSLGASHIFRRIYKKDMAAADLEATIAAAVAASRDVQAELHKRIEKAFADLDDGLKTEVASLYQSGIDAVEEMLDDCAGRAANTAEQRKRIVATVEDTIPELRSLLNGLEGAGITA
jgi:hypothetical protein